MSEPRPPVPLPIKRVLRQEAGYGCCVWDCGHPIYEYHHIIPYATEHHFRPDDMMLLCPNHHREATEGAMDEAIQRQHKAEPFNIARGRASGQLTVNNRGEGLDLGGHLFTVDEGELVRVDLEPLISIRRAESGTLLLTLRLYDQRGSLLAEIDENEWISDSPLPWDLDFSFRRLTIRSAPRQIALAIDARFDPVSVRGRLWGKDRLLTIDDKGLHAGQAHFIGGGRVNGAVIALASGETTGFSLVPRITDSPLSIGPPAALPYRRTDPKVGRNESCPCGSGKKFKRCHGAP